MFVGINDSIFSQTEIIEQMCQCPCKRFYKFGGQYSFLVQENKDYIFKITKILNVRDGYLLWAKTKIQHHNVDVIIVSPQSDQNKDFKCRFRVGKKYKMTIQKYFFIPAKHIGVESGFTVDVLLGKRTISINQSGDYYYLFVSQNADGLFIRDNQQLDTIYGQFSVDSIMIKQTIDNFIAHICFNDDKYNIIDTFLLKNSLRRYGTSLWTRNPCDLCKKCGNKNWSIDSVPSLANWEIEYQVSDTADYREMLKAVLRKHYKFPLDDSLRGKDILHQEYKLLYCSHENIYTIQVSWEIANVADRRYVAIVNVQKIDGIYKVVGLNRSYEDYGNTWVNGNKKYLQQTIDYYKVLLL